jgi:hypothetical protein
MPVSLGATWHLNLRKVVRNSRNRKKNRQLSHCWFPVMTHSVGLFGSTCLKTGHDYGVQKDCCKHDLIQATSPSVSDRIECVVR